MVLQYTFTISDLQRKSLFEKEKVWIPKGEEENKHEIQIGVQKKVNRQKNINLCSR